MKTKEIQTGYKENLFPHEDSQALDQVSQGGPTVLSQSLGTFKA